MPTVPEARGPQISPGGPDLPQLRSGAVPGAFGEGVAQAGQRLGGELDKLQNVITQHQVVMQQIKNKADADNAYVKGAEAMNQVAVDYTENQRGGNALPSLEEFTTKMEDARKAAADGLNPVVARQYEGDSRRLFANLVGSMSRHAASENNKYTIQTLGSKMDVAANLAVAHANDPAFLESAHNTIALATGLEAHYQGYDPAVAADKFTERYSKVLQAVIVQKANDDPIAASQFFEEHKDLMRGNEISTVDSFLKQRTEPYIAKQIVEDVLSGKPEGASQAGVIKADPQRYFSRLFGAGVTINSTERDPKHNADVGGVKNSFHIPENGWAVDVGPGTSGLSVKDMVAKAKAAGLGASEIIDESGKHHVHIGWSKDALSKREGPHINLDSARTIPELEGIREAGIRAVDAQVQRVYGNDPRIRDMAETEFDARYNRRHAALAATVSDAQNNVVTMVNGTDPEHLPTSLEDLQKQPGFSTSWQYLSASEQRGVMRQLKQNANPSISSFTAPQYEAFQLLDGESKSSPAKFVQRNPLDDPNYLALPRSYRLTMMQRRNTILAGQQVDSMTNRALTQVAPMIKGTDVANTPDNIDTYSRFASQLSREVQTYFDIHKKEPDQNAVRTMATELLADKAVWGGTKHTLPGRAFESENFVPAWFVTETEAEASRRGFTVTPEQMAALYQRRAARVR